MFGKVRVMLTNGRPIFFGPVGPSGVGFGVLYPVVIGK